MTDDPRENTWHPYPEYVSPRYDADMSGHTMTVDRSSWIAPHTDRYQGLKDGVWTDLDVEEVRILRTHNTGDHTIGVSVAYLPELES